MSDSDLSTPANLPADSEIERCLQRIVRDAITKDDEITIKIARSRAEKELGLETGFFKDNETWKQRSKDVINKAVEEPESPEKPKAKPTAKAGTKRKSEELPAGRKRVKKSPAIDSKDVEETRCDASEQGDSSEMKLDLDTGKTQPKSEEESALSEPPEDESEPHELNQDGKPADDSESELSSVIDDAPPKKSRQKKKPASPSTTKSKPSKPKPTKTTKPEKSTKENKDLTPDEEEIKRLQSWLLKCGIRKLWHRELAPYTTPKAKIAHLKAMLDDVGMTPRYSAEKARQIKEARELAAELEAAREFNEHWGHGSEGEESGEERRRGKKGEEEAPPPVRRMRPKGLVDFGDSGEDSD